MGEELEETHSQSGITALFSEMLDSTAVWDLKLEILV